MQRFVEHADRRESPRFSMHRHPNRPDTRLNWRYAKLKAQRLLDQKRSD
jgi:hypothetical protein